MLVLFNPNKLLFENAMCNQDQCFTNIKKFCLLLLLCTFITSSKKPISLVSLDLCFLQMCYRFITAFSSTCLHTDCSCFTNCSIYLSGIEVKKWPIILLHFSSTLTYSLLLNCNTTLASHWFPETKKHRWILK